MASSLQALVIGDPHFRAKYVRTIDDFIDQTQQLVEMKKPDIVVILGDTLHHHERTTESCHTRAVKWFMAMSKMTHVVVIIGNHDRPNNSHYLSDNHFFNGLKGHDNITIVDNVKSMTITKQEHGQDYQYNFVFVPYVPPGRFEEALSTLKTPISKLRPKAIFAHQEFKGAKMGAIISEHGDEWDPKNPTVITGHIHEYQKVGDNIIYVGTPYQTTYAENSNKGVYIFTFTRKGADAKRIRLNLRVKDTITITPEEFKTFALPDSMLDLRVVVQGPQADVEGVKKTARYKELRGLKNLKIVLRPQLEFKTSGKIVTKSYLDTLYDEVSNDQGMQEVYREVFQA